MFLACSYFGVNLSLNVLINMVLIQKQVRSDNDASEVGILGHFGTF